MIAQFEAWLLASDRSSATIKLRMRHACILAAEYDLQTVTVEQLETVLARSRNLAAETRKSMLSSWRVLFGWAAQRGIRADNPTLELSSIRVRARMPRVAPDEPLQRALEVAGSRERAMILLARFACLRLNEVTTLHTKDRSGDVLRVLGKGDKERLVYVNAGLMAALIDIERMQGPGFYFPGGHEGHLNPVTVNKLITRLTGYNPHSLRHAGATAAYKATGDLRAVQDMLGHASLATTQRYLHLDDDARRAVAAGTAFKIAA